MTTQKSKTTIALAAVLVALLISYWKQNIPAPVEEPLPEQSPYVVFYFVCGALAHVLTTTEPPLQANAIEPASREMLDIMKVTPPERILELFYVGPECSYPYNPPVEPID